jgi:hypothetical protein
VCKNSFCAGDFFSRGQLAIIPNYLFRGMRFVTRQRQSYFRISSGSNSGLLMELNFVFGYKMS